MSFDENIAYYRELLSEPPSTSVWQRLCRSVISFVGTRPRKEFYKEVLLPYLLELLETWPDYLRLFRRPLFFPPPREHLALGRWVDIEMGSYEHRKGRSPEVRFLRSALFSEYYTGLKLTAFGQDAMAMAKALVKKPLPRLKELAVSFDMNPNDVEGEELRELIGFTLHEFGPRVDSLSLSVSIGDGDASGIILLEEVYAHADSLRSLKSLSLRPGIRLKESISAATLLQHEAFDGLEQLAVGGMLGREEEEFIDELLVREASRGLRSLTLPSLSEPDILRLMQGSRVSQVEEWGLSEFPSLPPWGQWSSWPDSRRLVSLLAQAGVPQPPGWKAPLVSRDLIGSGRTASLRGYALKDEDLTQILFDESGSPHTWPDLVALDLSMNSLSNAAIAELFAHGATLFPNLRELNVRECRSYVSTAFLQAISKAPFLAQLETLIMDWKIDVPMITENICNEEVAISLQQQLWYEEGRDLRHVEYKEIAKFFKLKGYSKLQRAPLLEALEGHLPAQISSRELLLGVSWSTPANEVFNLNDQYSYGRDREGYR